MLYFQSYIRILLLFNSIVAVFKSKEPIKFLEIRKEGLKRLDSKKFSYTAIHIFDTIKYLSTRTMNNSAYTLNKPIIIYCKINRRISWEKCGIYNYGD